MLDILTVSKNVIARNFKLIEASPESLRECADRLDIAIKNMNQGESVLCELTLDTLVVCKPSAKPVISSGMESAQ